MKKGNIKLFEKKFCDKRNSIIKPRNKRLFSILVTEDDLRLFSDFLKKYSGYNEKKEKDAFKFTDSVLKRYDEKIADKRREELELEQNKAEEPIKLITSNRPSTMTNEALEKEVDNYRKSLENERKNLLNSEERQFSIKGLRNQIIASNNLKYNYTAKDIRDYKRHHRNAEKNYECLLDDLNKNEKEHLKTRTKEEIMQDKRDLSAQQTNHALALDMLTKDPKKYFKLQSRRNKLNAINQEVLGKPAKEITIN